MYNSSRYFSSSCRLLVYFRQCGTLRPFYLTQLLPIRIKRLIDPLYAAEPNDWTGDPLIDPGESHVSHLPLVLLRQFLNTGYNLLVVLRDASIEQSSCLVFLLRSSRGAKCRGWASQVSAAQWRPLRTSQSCIHTSIVKMSYRNQTHASFMAKLDHLPLFFTIKQIVLVLHADELGPSVLLGTELHQCELIGPHRASPDIADLACLDQIVESFHGLFDGSVGIEAVNL